ncbi:type III secretion protein HrpB4 [Burkholderia lata]|uniref:type III secretion protein HrpB4 n=1 Tax=Burkholderia lata (strain ATCC 17760 / DSM 23089 / LMG 22485 / NCIMB 9086 / R18194 / 383) TaxID=482957 RepID=UPI0014531E24|nr:type III secretion protein HrpB4 [Burkholderia lata]VWB88705.1 hypothetical protein BLA15816_04264 [Burkholderia lata]
MSADHPLVRMLAAFDVRVRELGLALADASLWRPVSGPVGAGSSTPANTRARALRAQAASRIWFAEAVPLAAFIEPDNRIALVEPSLLRRLLAARVLFRCRDAVRRSVDRRTRQVLTECVGRDALTAISDLPITGSGADEALPADLSPEALARDGWRIVTADGGCSNATLRNIIELGLATGSYGLLRADLKPGRNTYAGTAGYGDGARAAGGDADSFFSEVGHMFPELQWLFG